MSIIGASQPAQLQTQLNQIITDMIDGLRSGYYAFPTTVNKESPWHKTTASPLREREHLRPRKG